nr:sensor domain-containing diguanylate cyclase [Mycobacterium colombiense]
MTAVRRVDLLGTPAEERFDRITRLARRLFDVPMAVIDIVGEKLAWLKSAQGFDGFEGPRCDSYCHHTVLDDEIFVVRDARTDPRVCDSGFANTWVFYVGVSLSFEGERVGVLCIGDTEPRDFDPDAHRSLRDLAAMAEQELQVARMSETQLALARVNDELQMKANVDVLTRLWNRRAVFEIAETERLRADDGAQLAALLIDLDHFKAVNDTYGHPAGDEVLRVSAERLRASIRSVDAVGRIGGEEFLVLVTDAESDDVAAMAERIRATQADTPVRFGQHSIPVTCSVGYAIAAAGESVDGLVSRADEALYRAKSNGRNRVEPLTIDPDDPNSSHRRTVRRNKEVEPCGG